ncbi:hypothetical protein H4Q26_002697 [Puccinia striiformis f. sp. tritici PST-130]|nr:hypothetical protein H4Q26_002697 [Puccinia striiformis f. sp. tritici PST-130]
MLNVYEPDGVKRTTLSPMVEAQNANVSVNTLVKHKAVALPTRSRMVEPTTTTPELPDICHRYRWAFSRPSTDFSSIDTSLKQDNLCKPIFCIFSSTVSSLLISMYPREGKRTIRACWTPARISYLKKLHVSLWS